MENMGNLEEMKCIIRRREIDKHNCDRERVNRNSRNVFHEQLIYIL